MLIIARPFSSLFFRWRIRSDSATTFRTPEDSPGLPSPPETKPLKAGSLGQENASPGSTAGAADLFAQFVARSAGYSNYATMKIVAARFWEPIIAISQMVVRRTFGGSKD